MFDEGCVITAFYNHICLSETFINIAPPDFMMLQNIAFIMNFRCVGQKSFLGGEYSPQLPVVHPDLSKSFFGYILSLGHYQSHGISYISYFISGQYWLVGKDETKPVMAGDVLGCENSNHPRCGFCLPGINAQNLSMRVLATQGFSVDHPLHEKIIRVLCISFGLKDGILSGH
ncbi:MAG: hypothetical protein DDT18_01895 [Actinobacteria bacterium]|nr:hypothetical protein [Actinomycetota bacterium]